MRNLSIHCVLILDCLLALPPCLALDRPDILLPSPVNVVSPKASSTSQVTSSTSANGLLPVKFNAKALLSLPEGGEAHISLPRLGMFTIVHDRSEKHENGDVTWFGYFSDYGTDYRIIITHGDGGTAGLIRSPDGEFSLTPGAANEWLIDLQGSGFQAVPNAADDTLAPPLSLPSVRTSNTPSVAAAVPALGYATPANSTIDLMIIYTPGMAQRYGTGLSARLNNVVAIANQAYIDSGVGITLRLVSTTQIDYSETNSISIALNDLTSGVGAFAGVAALRKQSGADLVQLIRPYRRSVPGCGLAWISAANPDPSYGYSVSADGKDAEGTNTLCYDVTLAHELGHNLGAAHDRAHATGPGAYPYSYGYGFDGQFATIMAAGYINATPVAKFSSPNIVCAGSPCGVAANLPNAADNVQTLNNLRAAVADFLGPSSKECLFNWAESFYPGLFSPPGKSQLLSPYTYRYYAGTNAYLGVDSGNNHVYYLSDAVGLLDEGDLSKWLPLAGCQ
jgi:hypothetical protein